MPALVHLYKNQLFHYLKRLDFRLKIEFAFLLIIFVGFFSEKSVDLLRILLQRPGTSAIGITVFIEHIVLIPLALSTPFIYAYLLPRQKIIHALRLQPIRSADAFLLLFSSYLKYESLVIILLVPVIGAILFTLNLLYLLHLIFVIGSFLFILFTFMHLLVHKYKSKRGLSYSIYFLVIGIYFVMIYYLYSSGSFYLMIQAGVTLTALIILGIIWAKVWKYWDYDLFRLNIITHKNISSKSHRNWNRMSPFGSTILYALTVKEIISYTRNFHFLRIKFTGLTIYLIVLVIAQQTVPENYLAVVSIITFIYLWIHYTHQFNEKYVLPESAFFLKLLPFRYFQIWTAKFAAEMIFIAPVFIILIFSLLVSGANTMTTLYVFSTAFIFALFILATIVSVKLLFFDNPRKAGYIYHFMVVFSMVMIYNFYLVGPVVIFFTLIYLSFLSYRQFER